MLKNTKRNKSIEKAYKNLHRLTTDSLKTYMRGALAKILENYRNGPETLIIIPPIARGGNWLYEWLKADQISRQSGAAAFLAYREDMDPWLKEFPMLQQLTRDKSYVKFKTKRIIGVHQDINSEFSNQDLRNFIEKYLLSPSFINRQQKSKKYITKNSLVINVRRGDYYSDERVHYDFGINTVEYLKIALQRALKNHTPRNIVVVSDDLEWCRNNLEFLNLVSPTSFQKIGKDMFDDLAALSVARHLILTNTTFGYWGAYIGNRDENCFVYVPNIHQRGMSLNSTPQQHEKSWIQIKPPTYLKTWLEIE